MKHVWLIGMMGTGKTTVGARLATAIGMPFIDVDEWIVTRTGKEIDDLFGEGEAVFRQLEASMIRTIAKGPASVVSTGGGVVLDQDNIAAMRATGTMVLLTAAPEALIDRLSQASQDRPLLAGEGDIERIAVARQEVYRAAADIIVDTTSRDMDEITREVMECVGT